MGRGDRKIDLYLGFCQTALKRALSHGLIQLHPRVAKCRAQTEYARSGEESSQMKISKIEIENFRGLERIHFEPNPNVNVVVGPNAVGKTSILEAIRFTKALLAPRYFEETQQTLISLGAISPHFQFFGGQMDYAAIAGDINKNVRIALRITLAPEEVELLKQNANNLALSTLRSRVARNDQQSQFALAQFLSSPAGQEELKKAQEENSKELARITTTDPKLTLELLFDRGTRSFRGTDLFSQTSFTFLDQRLSARATLVDYFPADRAFPMGEVNIQPFSI